MLTILVLGALTLAWIVRQILCDSLRDVPGPRIARWTSLWIAYQARAGRKWLVVDELHKVGNPTRSRPLSLADVMYNLLYVEVRDVCSPFTESRLCGPPRRLASHLRSRTHRHAQSFILPDFRRR